VELGLVLFGVTMLVNGLARLLMLTADRRGGALS
jgi:ABC-type phosphate transport system permease subunit